MKFRGFTQEQLNFALAKTNEKFLCDTPYTFYNEGRTTGSEINIELTGKFHTIYPAESGQGKLIVREFILQCFLQNIDGYVERVPSMAYTGLNDFLVNFK